MGSNTESHTLLLLIGKVVCGTCLSLDGNMVCDTVFDPAASNPICNMKLEGSTKIATAILVSGFAIALAIMASATGRYTYSSGVTPMLCDSRTGACWIRESLPNGGFGWVQINGAPASSE